MDHAGRLVLPGDNDPVRVAISLTDTHLTVSSGGAVIGTWALDACKVETEGNVFVLFIQGDVARFIPDQPASFTREVLHHWPPARLSEAIRAVRDATTDQSNGQLEHEGGTALRIRRSPLSRWRALEPGRRLQIASLLGGVVLVILLAVFLGGPRDRGPSESLPPLPTPPPSPGLFEGSLVDATEAWNEAVRHLRTDLFVTRLPEGSQMQVQLNSRLTLYGTADPRTGRLRALMLSTGPGTGEEMQQVLAAWGALIAAASPELAPGERRSVLTALGVDLNAPLTIGLNRVTDVGPVRYWLQSGVISDRVLFGVEARDSSF